MKSIRNVIRQCIRYRRFNSNRVVVEPGVPPEDKVRDAAVFEVVDTDLARPLYLSDSSKAWVVSYICAVYHTVHLELISSLSMESFLQSLRRLIAKRGRLHIIHSDNGTNYIGSANALSSVNNWDKLATETSI